MKNIINIQKYTSPCGELVLGSLDGKLCQCDWVVEKHRDIVDRRLKKQLGATFVETTSDVIELASAQLDEYFAGTRQVFTVPLLFVGSDFQRSVWHELMNIPYGKTISYAALAVRLGRPSAVRAVANANGANAISIFAPCHRVIGSNNTLGGYGGGLNAKRYLLQLESSPTIFG